MRVVGCVGFPVEPTDRRVVTEGAGLRVAAERRVAVAGLRAALSDLPVVAAGLRAELLDLRAVAVLVGCVFCVLVLGVVAIACLLAHSKLGLKKMIAVRIEHVFVNRRRGPVTAIAVIVRTKWSVS